ELSYNTMAGVKNPNENTYDPLTAPELSRLNELCFISTFLQLNISTAYEESFMSSTFVLNIFTVSHPFSFIPFHSPVPRRSTPCVPETSPQMKFPPST